MALYAVIWRYVDDTALVDKVRPRHRQYLRNLVTQGLVRQAGPFSDASGGLVMYEVADDHELKKLVENDPFMIDGAISRYEFWQWSPLVGPLAG